MKLLLRSAALMLLFSSAWGQSPFLVEDFQNGITWRWDNEGYDSLGNPRSELRWEYRGRAGFPNFNNGPYSGMIFGSPFYGQPIQSETRTNGFAVLSSYDFPTVFGRPYRSELTTPSYDFTTY